MAAAAAAAEATANGAVKQQEANNSPGISVFGWLTGKGIIGVIQT